MKKLSVVLWLLSLVASAGTASAGHLVIENTSARAIACTADGWTVASGYVADRKFRIEPGATLSIEPNALRRGAALIDWAECGSGLRTRKMAITPDGPNGLLIVNGQQVRALNASLYAFIPNVPGQTFDALVRLLTLRYQQMYPDVQLHLVMDPNIGIYSFTNLPKLLGAGGYDVLEMDMLYLAFVANTGLINQAVISGTQPLPVARQAVTYLGQIWAVPSWLCIDFFYGKQAKVQDIGNLSQLLSYLKTMPTGINALVGDFNGSWRLPAMYINSYVQTHGYNNLPNAFKMPPDPQVISSIVTVTDTCAAYGRNNCTNNTFHMQPSGTTEKWFVQNSAANDVGFSEQSFYMYYYGLTYPIYATPMPWGPYPQPLLYADGLVTNSSTCRPATTCSNDAQNFMNMITDPQTKLLIVTSADYQGTQPWRTLLVPSQPFYDLPQIRGNALYTQYARVFANAQPFPNSFSAAQQTQMATQICQALKRLRPDYSCSMGEEVEKEPANRPGRSIGRSDTVAAEPAVMPMKQPAVMQ
jgi:thiamine pyridinylase